MAQLHPIALKKGYSVDLLAVRIWIDVEGISVIECGTAGTYRVHRAEAKLG